MCIEIRNSKAIILSYPTHSHIEYAPYPDGRGIC